MCFEGLHTPEWDVNAYMMIVIIIMMIVIIIMNFIKSLKSSLAKIRPARPASTPMYLCDQLSIGHRYTRLQHLSDYNNSIIHKLGNVQGMEEILSKVCVASA